MNVSIIVAMSEGGVIGVNNQLPWHLSEDLKRFKRLTMGSPIIMGRKTYESIGKPLPGRENIVLTSNSEYNPQGVTVVSNLTDAFQASRDNGAASCFVIGGARVFKEALPLADRIFLTKIHKKFEGDTFFPLFSLSESFRVVEEDRHQSDQGFEYSFLTADRVA